LTSTEEKIRFLAGTALMKGVGPALLPEISRYVFEKQLRRGEVVLTEGGEADAMYFVVQGVLKLYKTSAEGKEQIVSLVRPGDFFNEVPLLDGGPAPANVEALSPALLYGIQKTSMGIIVRQYPAIAGNLLTMLARRIRYLISLVEDLSFRSVSSRVAKILLENASGTAVGARLTQRDMAALAGTAREVVSRSLKYLEERGFIEMRHHQIIIRDRQGLKSMVEPDI
jgi:CRP-like cAMP-binding protein